MATINEQAKNIKRKRNKASRPDEIERSSIDLLSNVFVGLEEIDGTILKFFNDELKITVKERNTLKVVPAIMSTMEKSAISANSDVPRDQSGQIMFPYITVERSSSDKRSNIGMFNGALYYTYPASTSKKYRHDRFAVNNKIKRPTEMYVIAMPVYTTVSYRVVAKTLTVTQMNKIVESITFSNEQYWGDKNGYLFFVSVGSTSNQNSNTESNVKIHTTEFTLTVEAYILPEEHKNIITTQKAFDKSLKITVSEETMSEEDVNRLGIFR